MRWLLSIALIVMAVAGKAAESGDWQNDAPGVVHRIDPARLSRPFATESAANGPEVVPVPKGAVPRVPSGFAVSLWASGLDMPRVLRVAPNGDVLLAESGAGRVRLFRPVGGAGRPGEVVTFIGHLDGPFGIAFWPPRQPRYVYVAETGRVRRYPYQPGDLAPRGPAETVMAQLPTGGHWTRDLAVAGDGSRMFLSIGSAGNLGRDMPARSPADLRAWDATNGLGAAWGSEAGRAVVLQFDPATAVLRPFAQGLRNCSGLAVQPGSGAVWCATNERDGLGDDVPPDYVTHLVEGGFYGWPWYYIGDHGEPRLPGQRPDLAGRVIVPDVLIQAHSAPLAIAFYDAAGGPAAFPAEYRGDAFVALHGSWNRAVRTGYKVIRLRMKNGVATGEYEDFVTGFVASAAAVWGRPAGVAVATDGALLVSDDANGNVWRIAFGH